MRPQQPTGSPGIARRRREGSGARLERLDRALEAGQIGAWEWDLATGEMWWSAQMWRNLGRIEQPGADLYAVLLASVHPSDRARIEQAFTEFRSRIGPLRVEARLLWPGDEPHWIAFVGQVIGDRDGRPARMVGVTIDTTGCGTMEEAGAAALRDGERQLRELNEQLERRADERARQLETSRAQVRAIYDNSPDWLTLFRATKDGRFVYEDLNRATERAYGLPYDRVVGRPLEDILGPQQAELPLRLMRECIRTGQDQRYTARRTLAGMTRTIDVMFVRLPEQIDGDFFIMATARDITERVAMEERLRQSQKIEAVGQLTGGLAHDFNNLLTAVIGNLELIAPALPPESRARRHLRAAQRAAENGAKLTEQLLAFSRRQPLQLSAVDLSAVIAGMGEMLGRSIGATVRIVTDLAPGLWQALVDPTQIEVAILNLAINARDAMPLGGTLTIETRNLPHFSSTLPSEMSGRDCVSIAVRDTGTGMSEEVLRSAVEPFFTTKQPGKGSGLGLTQVYRMVQQSKGTLQIESRPGAGTTVRLLLPRADQTDREVPADDAEEQLPSRPIPVIDEEPGVSPVARTDSGIASGA